MAGHWGTVMLTGGLRSELKRVVQATWETLPPHPVVMADSRGTHQRVRAMGVSDGALIIGYGDWGINTGPLAVVGYDLGTLEPVTLMPEQPPELSTEAWDRIRIIDGKAYLPHTDPTLNNQGAYTTNERGFWESVKVGENPSMIHTFDVVKFKGRMMACGSMSWNGGAGVVYTETAPGSRTFARSLLGGIRDDFARFYKFFVRDVGNEVMVQNSDGGLESFVTTDGDNWTLLPDEPQNHSNTSYDRPDPLLIGYTDHGVLAVSAVIHHDGWVWIGGNGGVVKRALLLP